MEKRIISFLWKTLPFILALLLVFGFENPVYADSSPDGIWYEQNEFGDTVEIRGNTIISTSYNGEYSFEETCSFREEDGIILIETEDYYIYEDMSYDPERDILIAYSMSYMDGDGGHHYLEFHRTEYIPPPEPVYPPPVDYSDPDAKKDFEDLTIRRMEVSFYDEGTPYDVSSNMAQEPPFPDDYSYDLQVLEDGTGLISSSFCQEIELSKDIVDELQALFRESDPGSFNGLDIHTEGLPYGFAWYEAEFELASGDIIRSSANGENVPGNWKTFQESMHHLLFFAFVDAGYQINGGQFHSTKPMKRVQASEKTSREETGILEEGVRIIPDWEKSFDYSLDTQYFVFTDPENRYPVLMKTLDELSRKYRETAEEELRKDYELMEGVLPSVWEKADRKYCYSLYAVDHWELNNNVFSFMISEGHANSLGVGESGYGQYRYLRYFIDVETGEVLSLSDLFVSPEALADYLTEQMVNSYGTHNDSGKRVHAEDFPEVLSEAVLHPEPEGIGWTVYYDKLILWMPLSMFPGSDSQTMEYLYYDEIQDILGDKYTEVW